MHHAKEVRQYIRQNHDSWYAFATGDKYGIECEPGDIIMVRSTMKTSAWAVAAFKDSTDRSHSLAFDGTAGLFGNAGIHLASQTTVQSSVEYRIGPPKISPVPQVQLYSALTSSVTTAPIISPDLPEYEFAASRSIVLDPHKNQTIFLGYWKIKRRLGFLKTITAASSPQDFLPHDGTPDLHLSSEDSISDSSEFFLETNPLPTKVSRMDLPWSPSYLHFS